MGREAGSHQPFLSTQILKGFDLTIKGIQGEKSHPGFRIQKPGKGAEPTLPCSTQEAELVFLLSLSVSLALIGMKLPT